MTVGDAARQESNLSFVVRATIPDGTNTNTATLTGFSFSSDTTCFHVYRGRTPSQLLRIAASQPVASAFTDTGLSEQLVPPPDANYDHTNVYWRRELQLEFPATLHSSTTVGDPTLTMEVNAYRWALVRIQRGKGAGQERTVAENDAVTLTTSVPWDMEPDETSTFTVAESGWHFGAAGSCGPLEFEVPTQVWETVHVSARSANVYDRECAQELSPVTRWRITGGGAALDTDVPGKPVFGITTRQTGDVGLAPVAFENLENTRTISSGTLTLHYWNELSSPSQILLGADVGETDTAVNLSQAGSALPSSLIQIESELLRVNQVENGGTRYQVARGANGSSAASHTAPATVYELGKVLLVVPFAKDFFGSPASGDFSFNALLPDARIVSAELFVTNAKGNSETSTASFASTTDGGLRTLSGGQYSLQVEGFLAIQSNAVPPLVVQTTHTVRATQAVVSVAPQGGAIELDVRQNGVLYCHLTIPDGVTYSAEVSGCGLPPLTAGALITLDIGPVPQASGTAPGRDLTVMIRL